MSKDSQASKMMFAKSVLGISQRANERMILITSSKFINWMTGKSNTDSWVYHIKKKCIRADYQSK